MNKINVNLLNLESMGSKTLIDVRISTGKGNPQIWKMNMYYNQELSCGIQSLTLMPSEAKLRGLEKRQKGAVKEVFKQLIPMLKKLPLHRSGTIIVSNNLNKDKKTYASNDKVANKQSIYLKPALNAIAKVAYTVKNPNSKNYIRTWLL